MPRSGPTPPRDPKSSDQRKQPRDPSLLSHVVRRRASVGVDGREGGRGTNRRTGDWRRTADNASNGLQFSYTNGTEVRFPPIRASRTIIPSHIWLLPRDKTMILAYCGCLQNRNKGFRSRLVQDSVISVMTFPYARLALVWLTHGGGEGLNWVVYMVL